MSQYPYLADLSFLKEFDKIRNKKQTVKITVLDWNEEPVQEITGRVTSGSVNVSGDSAMRRTANLSLICPETENDLTNVNRLISINKKIKLEIGFLNETDKYSEYTTLWFPLGIYVITNASIQHSGASVTISVNLQDKMCLLNGTCGGTLPAETQFDELEYVDVTGNRAIEKPTIYQIIQEIVNHFGGEQLGKIIISDVGKQIKKVMKWNGNNPIYLIERDGQAWLDLKQPAEMPYVKYEQGEDIGYIYSDFYYPSELIGSAGSSLCEVLDTIKNTLGNYEYFYDLNGNFIFQEIKNYLNTSKTTVDLQKMNTSDYIVDFSKGKTVYDFNDGVLITSYSNSPNYANVKNDFLVWGKKNVSNNISVPIRYHLTIDNKPVCGSHNILLYTDENDNIAAAEYTTVASYEELKSLPVIPNVYYKAGNAFYIWDGTTMSYKNITNAVQEEENFIANDFRTELYLQGAQNEVTGGDTGYYYAELKNEWPRIWDMQNNKMKDEVLENPSSLNFYLDFIDAKNSAINELSVSNIGRRTKVINDDSINCIFEPEIPNYVMIAADGTAATEAERTKCINAGQPYIQVPIAIYNNLVAGGHLNSAYELIRASLYEYTSYNESISLNSLPIYYLEPNVRISVSDAESGIYGDYVIKSFSLPLDTSANMSIQCTRAIEKI